MPAPALLPLFRSELELELLGELFVRPAEARSVSDLARAVGATVQTTAREIVRLEDAGVVCARTQGRNKIIEANWRLGWAPELLSLLDKTVGPRALLADALGAVPGIEEAWIFGSWAARAVGRPGPAPRDIDLLVVGNGVDPVEVAAATSPVARRTGIDVNPVYVAPDEWARPKPGSFAATLQERPLVRLDITDASRA